MLNVLITVDVENPQTDYRNGLVVSNLIDPLIDNESCGTSKLAEIFERNSVKGVFFVNTSEKYIFDDSIYRSLCSYLHARGHEIGIHSHPEWIADDGRIHMWQFSYAEQLSMLSEMKHDITHWTGEAPISHRAGAYGINYDTLKALDELNIKVDSSVFAEHKNCKVQLSYNKLVKAKNLLEVPVTGFHKIKRLCIGKVKIPFMRSFIKTDIDHYSV
jgi:peptidoglycan/xylan/chitin deacetylase (PgdA/CDA1 family)